MKYEFKIDNLKVISFFFKEFQPMVSTPDSRFLSLDQDTNQFVYPSKLLVLLVPLYCFHRGVYLEAVKRLL